MSLALVVMVRFKISGKWYIRKEDETDTTSIRDPQRSDDEGTCDGGPDTVPEHIHRRFEEWIRRSFYVVHGLANYGREGKSQ